MSDLITRDTEYAEWIGSIKERFHSAQIKAATRVNQELLRFYWSLGRDIVAIHAESRWGTGFFKTLSLDMKNALPEQKGFSETNLRYITRFYKLYSSNLPQVGEEIDDTQIPPQVGEELLSIPWGHHKLIIDRCEKAPEKAVFYVRKTYENNWSRAVLLNWLDTDLYERSGKAITNFDKQLPAVQGDLAKQIIKDPYNFDFLSMTEGYNEKELKNALTDNIVKFLMELGTGFAFVGKEYRIVVGDTEQYLDLLFYNIRLHCYVVVEVKVEEFSPSDIGQLGTYVVAVNHQLKSDDDNPTIGLEICKGKDNVLAKYALESSGQPVGISEYELSKVYPADFKSSLPSIEEIEKELGNDGTEG